MTGNAKIFFFMKVRKYMYISINLKKMSCFANEFIKLIFKKDLANKGDLVVRSKVYLYSSVCLLITKCSAW